MDLGPLPIISRKAIQAHYDWCSWWYASLWGDHIHHGYWEDGETPEVAQIQLIQRLADACSLGQGADVLDAGCGLGGSSLWMAREHGCRVLGVTLSPIQARMARRKIEQAGLSDQVTILGIFWDPGPTMLSNRVKNAAEPSDPWDIFKWDVS